jgi:hypothetical protein
MTDQQRIEQLEQQVKTLTSTLKSLIELVRSAEPSLERDCDGEILGVDIDWDYMGLRELTDKLS